MEKNETVEEFYNNTAQEVIARAAAEDEENYRENILTEIYIDYLEEAAELEDGNICYYFNRGLKLNGYSLIEPEDNDGDISLSLFATIYNNSPEVYSVPPSDVQAMFTRLKKFFVKSTQGLYRDIEEAFDAYDIARSIYEYRDKITYVNLFVFTNGKVRSMELPPEDEDGVKYYSNVWDIQRIYRLAMSGTAREDIFINLGELGCRNLSCIYVRTPGIERTDDEGNTYTSGAYTSYFTVIPGETLYKIYERYNARLLERNVRAFLQTKGKVNAGIRSTITKTPEMFLAYNNGISGTAAGVTKTDVTASTCVITEIDDFQIVNGGQTTASIFNACIKNKEPLENIQVQAKLTVLDDPAEMDTVVPLISRYANSQNKVNEADLRSNDKYHQAIEQLSRTVWAPAKTGGEQQTMWFYERARGQYADERSRAKNVKAFDAQYPKKQYFDKIKLAKYLMLWDQKPDVASLGGQRCFTLFTKDMLLNHKNYVPDQTYYEELIGKNILYNGINSVVKNAGFEAYWANITYYTMALLSHACSQVLDFGAIWKAQAVPECILNDCEKIAVAFNDYLLKSAAGKNVTQWCKKKACWEGAVSSINVVLSEETRKYTKVDRTKTIKGQATDLGNKDEQALIDDLMKVDSKTWWDIAKWGKETQIWPSYMNGIAATLAKNVRYKKAPSIKQAKQGLKMLSIGVEKGLISDDVVKNIVTEHRSMIPE